MNISRLQKPHLCTDRKTKAITQAMTVIYTHKSLIIKSGNIHLEPHFKKKIIVIVHVFASQHVYVKVRGKISGSWSSHSNMKVWGLNSGYIAYSKHLTYRAISVAQSHRFIRAKAQVNLKDAIFHLNIYTIINCINMRIFPLE